MDDVRHDDMSTFDVLVVGAGFSGATCAERLASAGKRVLVVDQRTHVGGNAYDETNERGITCGRYGPHIFHTNSADVYAYVSRFTGWRPYTHRVLSSTSKGLVPVPINRTTLAAFGGDLEAAKAEMFTPYTRKQWGPHAADLSPSVAARVAPRDSDDDRYFTDAYQGMPADGYAALFGRMLDHPNITVELGRAASPEWARSFPVTIWTGPIDVYFNHCYGPLPYRSARFTFETLPISRALPAPVVNYPHERYPYTRVCEFKQLTGQRSPFTTVAYEFPQADGEPYWPVPTTASAALYHRYETLARQTPNVHFCGRLGRFRYLDMGPAIAGALKLTRDILAEESIAS